MPQDDQEKGSSKKDRQKRRQPAVRAIEGMNDALCTVFKEVRALENEVHSHGLERRYQQGLKLMKIKADQNAGGSTYGKKAIEKIAEALGESDEAIYAKITLAKAFTEKEIKDLQERKTDAGQVLSYSHIRNLAQIDNPAKRKNLLERALKGCWTSEKLLKEVQSAKKATKSKPDTKTQGPKDFDRTVKHEVKVVDRVLNQLAALRSDPKSSLAARAADIPVAEITPDRIQEVQDFAKRMRDLAEKAEEYAQEADEVSKALEKRSADKRPQRSAKAVAT